VDQNYSTHISASVALAYCEDGSQRTVVSYDLDGQRVLVSCPWRHLLFSHVLGTHLAAAHLLDFLLSIAAFEVDGGIWTARVSATCIALACVTAQGRNTIYQHLRKLSEERFIDYQPAKGILSPALIRIPAVNRRSGFILFDAKPDWRPSFVRAVDPKFRLADLATPDHRADKITPEQLGGLWATIPVTPPAGVLHLDNNADK